METIVPEEAYPIAFQKNEAETLGRYLEQRQCVNLVGMKRVGISHFLRFFLSNKDVIPTYVSKAQRHLFIPVDLSDLVEQEVYPFWTLTFKRIVDAATESDLSQKNKEKISVLFDKTIQSHDLFLVIDGIRHALVLIVEEGILPTIFFPRFDRLKDKFNPSFFDNLEGLREATHGKLAFVFTSYRSLGSMFPAVRTQLSVFAQMMHVKPVGDDDMKIIYEEYKNRYHLHLSEVIEKALFLLIHGYVQYLQLALVILNEKKDQQPANEADLLTVLLSDERIVLQSEELWESLSKEEKKILLQVVKKAKAADIEKEKGVYLWDTGIVIEMNGGIRVFSPLFERFLQHIEEEEHKRNKVAHLTRKENLLFNLLKKDLGEICEREKIIEGVWPEYSEFGVSDWAIDRLVARVRVKLREQNSPYEIVTVRTRGYKLTSAKE